MLLIALVATGLPPPVAAVKHTSTFCPLPKHPPRTRSGAPLISTRKADGKFCERGGGRLHALEIVPFLPRRSAASQPEKSHDEKSHDWTGSLLEDSVNLASVDAAQRVLLHYNFSHMVGNDDGLTRLGGGSPSLAPIRTKSQGGLALAGTAMLLFLAVLAIFKCSPAGCWRYYLAGGICASTSHAITTPIDVVKTRKQIDPWLQEKTMLEATLEIVKKGGPLALLVGLGPTALGYLIEGAVKFGIYEATKPFAKRFVAAIAHFFAAPALDSGIISLFLCGLISGTAASVMLCPMEALRIRLVSDGQFSGKNSAQALLLMIRKEGIQSITKGLLPMFCKQIPYTITKNVSFDLFTTWSYRVWREMGNSVSANVKFTIPLLSAMAAAVLSCVSSHPGDVLLSLVNANEGPKRTRDLAKEIWNGKDGARGFFVGIKPRFLHVLFIVTIQLLIYDYVKRLVGIPATGMG